MKKLLTVPIKAAALVFAILTNIASVGNLQSQSSATNPAVKKYQARPPKTQPFGAEAFAASPGTTIRWLGNGGFLINSRGTTIMIDPMLEGFDMPFPASWFYSSPFGASAWFADPAAEEIRIGAGNQPVLFSSVSASAAS